MKNYTWDPNADHEGDAQQESEILDQMVDENTPSKEKPVLHDLNDK